MTPTPKARIELIPTVLLEQAGLPAGSYCNEIVQQPDGIYMRGLVFEHLFDALELGYRVGYTYDEGIVMLGRHNLLDCVAIVHHTRMAG